MLNVNKNGLSFRLMTLREYVNMTAVMNNGSKEQKEFIIANLIESHFGISYKSISKSKAEYMICVLTLHSISQFKLEMVSTCQNCGRKHDVLFDGVIQHDDTPLNEIVIDDCIIHLREPRLFEDDSIIHMVESCIEKIELNGSLIDIADMSDEDNEELFKILTIENIEKIINEINRKDRLYMNVPCKCPTCQTEYIDSLVGFKSIFEVINE